MTATSNLHDTAVYTFELRCYAYAAHDHWTQPWPEHLQTASSVETCRSHACADLQIIECLT